MQPTLDHTARIQIPLTVQSLHAPTSTEWRDWKWQQRHAITRVEDIQRYFPGLNRDTLARIGACLQDRKITVTPYTLNLIEKDASLRPVDDDPVWRQLIPDWAMDPVAQGLDYDGESENWELPGEMVTPICQHKYDNRVILRLSNVCHAYCQFCYEALRTLEKESTKSSMRKQDWQATLNYIAGHETLDEVILSGGEPLMHSDAHLDTYLGDLRDLRPDLIIRLHTRALTFNPFRITDGLIDILARHNVTAIGLHVAHPNEITEEFISAARRLAKVCPILFANIPFLQGVNDDYATLVALCLKLYRNGIQPHYLYQFMPFSPGAPAYRTNISAALEIVSKMKRRISNIAVPEYVLPHKTGKYTVPLYLGGEQPTLVQRADGEYLHFTNWQGHACVFPE
ncbi:KamA family radical SAM protein [Burkholderia latens]|uniref:Radical SAM protein n=1 Tax=Burkholderia latens TaxID=488446 RepID=A0A6H9T4N3_9BURK|nr:radical SAM protein [Burkholderia latens]KAB0644179.1 radical SAM protein [Burkholderia latens]VWB44235.1 radical SAM superfamily protein [Burkholderia latens]